LPPIPDKSTRFLAIETLCQLQKSRKPVNGLFSNLISQYKLSDGDRQLATNIIYGTLRLRQSLDLILQDLCTQPLTKLKPFVYQALTVGLYQIFFLDRIPESAAVNESVKALQAAHLPKKLQGFVNGVLRNSIRRRDKIQALLANSTQPILNHPQWLSTRWKKRYGWEETIRICQQNNKQPPLTLQVNACNTGREQLLKTLAAAGITAQKGNYSEDALILNNYHGGVSRLPGYSEGDFQVQDQGAQLLARLFGPMTPQGEYLDGCAGVGGKTSVMLQLGQAVQARVFAVEPDRERQETFKENMRRLHPEQPVPLFPGTLQDFSAACQTRFHGILLDAPCSGTGVTGRHPDIRWNRRAEDLPNYQKTQLELLQKAASLLRPQGILIYATCSLEEEENEEVIKYFLAANTNFSREDCTEFLPPAARSLIKNGSFAPLPEPGIDGFFGARLVREF
jgi:16S rRNA (cytosine967-C5)-methyltransferase